jgi:ribosomal-protein-alanine N-acetyltransferase
MLFADLDSIIALESASAAASHWSRAEYLRCLEDSEKAMPERVCLTAELEGAVVGFVVLRLLKLPDSVEAELESILVAPSHRGRGIGAELMAAAFQAVRLHGARHIDLEVRASNRTAIRLYERFGMVGIGRRPGYYRAPEEDAVLMRIRL